MSIGDFSAARPWAGYSRARNEAPARPRAPPGSIRFYSESAPCRARGAAVDGEEVEDDQPLTQKTLIMAGRDDPIVPLANARLLRLLIKRSRLEIYDDGHLFMISSAEAVSQTVEAFLRE